MILYKFRSLHEFNCDGCSHKMRERILDIANNKRLYCEKWIDFRDQHEGAYWTLKKLCPSDMTLVAGLKGAAFDRKVESLGLIQRAVNTRLRVCSLTKGPLSNEKLWKEYGDNHRGVAIEFEFAGPKVEHPLYQITYQDEDQNSRGLRNIFAVLASVGMDLNRISESLLTWKGRKYSFENEVRLICHQSELEPPAHEGEISDRTEMALYRLEKMENGENCYFYFCKLLSVKRVLCGRQIADGDFEFLKENVVEVPVCHL